MKIGLTEREINLINSVLCGFPEVHAALLFGSRAKNIHQAGSDVDLALQGIINLDVLAGVKARLEALPLPYFFDVIDYQSVNNPDLKKHIDSFGFVIYRAKS